MISKKVATLLKLKFSFFILIMSFLYFDLMLFKDLKDFRNQLHGPVVLVKLISQTIRCLWGILYKKVFSIRNVPNLKNWNNEQENFVILLPIAPHGSAGVLSARTVRKPILVTSYQYLPCYQSLYYSHCITHAAFPYHAQPEHKYNYQHDTFFWIQYKFFYPPDPV